MTSPSLRTSSILLLALAVTALLAVPSARAEEGEVGIVERLGETLPDGLVFNDEAGNPVELKKLLRGPTILTLVYFRCPSICGPLLNEVAHTVDEVDNVSPGKDFDLITVSFDPSETPDMAATGKRNLIGRMTTKVPADAWRFLTGNQENIKRLADSVGFLYKRSKDGADFDHAGTVIFVTKEGKIVRYLSGLAMLPFDMEMALNDAREGTPRTIFQKIQNLCFGYDYENKTYTLLVNRIVLFVTLLGVGVFALILVLKRRRKPARDKNSEPSAASGAVEGGTV